jgi:hypothetical protein
MYDDWLQNMENGNLNCVVFLDVSKSILFYKSRNTTTQNAWLFWYIWYTAEMIRVLFE